MWGGSGVKGEDKTIQIVANRGIVMKYLSLLLQFVTY